MVACAEVAGSRLIDSGLGVSTRSMTASTATARSRPTMIGLTGPLYFYGALVLVCVATATGAPLLLSRMFTR